MRLEAITLAAIVLFTLAFTYICSTGVQGLKGSDDQAEDVISSLTGGSYHPWFQPVYTPPNRVVESLIFSLQAAIGSLIIGYFLIYYRASSRAKASNKEEENDKGLDAQPSR